MDDTLDSVLAGSDEEEETEAVLGKVLDEIGIEMTSKVGGWNGESDCRLSCTSYTYMHICCVEQKVGGVGDVEYR